MFCCIFDITTLLSGVISFVWTFSMSDFSKTVTQTLTLECEFIFQKLRIRRLWSRCCLVSVSVSCILNQQPVDPLSPTFDIIHSFIMSALTTTNHIPVVMRPG